MISRALFWLPLLGLAAGAVPASAQVLRDLDPIHLKYGVLTEDLERVGEAEVSFEFVDSARGKRLQVTAVIHYTVGQTSPVELHEETTLSCDEEGVEKFDSVRRFGDTEVRYTAFRSGEDYHLTIHRAEETEQATRTAGVQRSNLALFCAGFLEEPVKDGPMIRDFALLVPSIGTHVARQLVRQGTFPVDVESGETISILKSHMRQSGSKLKDRLWHLNDERQPLVRSVERADHGAVIYELEEIDGTPVGWGKLLR